MLSPVYFLLSASRTERFASNCHRISNYGSMQASSSCSSMNDESQQVSIGMITMHYIGRALALEFVCCNFIERLKCCCYLKAPSQHTRYVCGSAGGQGPMACAALSAQHYQQNGRRLRAVAILANSQQCCLLSLLMQESHATLPFELLLVRVLHA